MSRTVALALALALASACNPALRVGVVLPETGDAAVYGASIKSGVRLAFDRVQAGPPALEVSYRDSGSDPARAAAAADALYDAGALLVIGGATSAEAAAMIPVADRQRRPLLSPSASAPDLTRRSRLFFRVYPSDELEGVRAAELLARERRCRTVLIVREDTAYTRGLLPVFIRELTSLGARVAGSVQLDETGWQAALRRALADSPPDGIYLCGYGEAFLAGLRAVRTLGFRGTVCATSAINASPILQRAGTLAEGVYLPLAGLDLESAQGPARAFVRDYQRVYNLPPDIYAAHGYDAALVAVAALAAPGGRGGADLAARLRALRGLRGVTGPLGFDEDGDTRHALRDHWVRHGRVEEVEPPPER